MRRGIAVLIFAALAVPAAAQTGPKVKPGIEVLLGKEIAKIRGKRVGLITNPTGVTPDLTANVDALIAAGVKVTALFGPEHGVRGDAYAGAKVSDEKDPVTGVPVYSLYGKVNRPTPEMMKNVDVLLYDIQDVGSRSYTYINTMGRAMQSAKEAGKPFLVLDRPCPFGGVLVDGNILVKTSGIGMYPIPYVYGMTCGELAQYYNAEFKVGCDLTVIPLEGWKRGMTFRETGLPWVPTSPHVPHPETALLYNLTGIMGELDMLNPGVGYTMPFELFGSEWMDGRRVAEELNRRNLPGLRFRPMAWEGYYRDTAGKKMRGCQVHVVEPTKVQPVAAQMHILEVILKVHPDRRIFDTKRTGMFDNAMGGDRERKMLEAGKSAEAIIATWRKPLEDFMTTRKKYLIYP